MQQDRKNIEEKLRQLDNQQLPDLSRMDEHWKAMNALLHPGNDLGIRKKKWLWFITVLLVAGGTTLVMDYKNEENKNGPAVKQILTQQFTDDDAKLNDSVIVMAVPGNVFSTNLTAAKIVKKTNTEIEAGNAEISLPLQYNPGDSTLITNSPEAKKILQELLTSLAKNTQEFIIDNTRDTTLFATEGSSLFIPAKSLGGNSKVKISLKEFYKTSDIVMNKLSTTSNQEQLITGGMLHIEASVNDKPVNVLPGKAIKWYLPDTSNQLNEMQLFNGEERNAGINWISTGQKFRMPVNITEVRVLDLRNEPFKTKEKRKGLIGYFSIADKPQLSREQIRELYREKYGYYKVRFRKGWKRTLTKTELVDGLTYSNLPVGDSAWIAKEVADRYKLQSTQTRIRQGYAEQYGNNLGVLNSVFRRGAGLAKQGEVTGLKDTLPYSHAVIMNVSALLEKRYSVDINSLGWINCDRFYSSPSEKVNYLVDLKDSANNYFTMMVFSEMRSMMTGNIMGNAVQFRNVPAGEAVKIISIGVDKTGKTVMAMKETKISKKGLDGLPFELAASPEIKSALIKIDR